MRLTPLPVGGHIEIVVTGCPLLMLLEQERAEQADGGFTVREDADGTLSTADLLVEALNAIGGAQSPPVGSRQRQHSCRIVKGRLQRGYGIGRTFREELDHLVKERARRSEVGASKSERRCSCISSRTALRVASMTSRVKCI